MLDDVNTTGKKEIVCALKEIQSSEGQFNSNLNEDNTATDKTGGKVFKQRAEGKVFKSLRKEYEKI